MTDKKQIEDEKTFSQDGIGFVPYTEVIIPDDTILLDSYYSQVLIVKNSRFYVVVTDCLPDFKPIVKKEPGYFESISRKKIYISPELEWQSCYFNHQKAYKLNKYPFYKIEDITKPIDIICKMIVR